MEVPMKQSSDRMEILIATKIEIDDLVVECEISPAFSPEEEADWRKQFIDAGLREIEARESVVQRKLESLNKEIGRLTNDADGLDYAAAVSSGMLAGLIDALWVGEFSFERGKAWSNKTVNRFVMDMAKKTGYEGDRLDGAIAHLENKFKVPGDNAWHGEDVKISARSHHLDDLAHHPTPVGLFFSILTQFTEEGYFSNQDGEWIPISIDKEGKKLIGHDLKTKIFCGTVNWFFHLVSDMSGSNKTAGAGMGIPGPVISILKELSALPGIKDRGLAKKLHDIYVKEKFDLRGEMAVAHEVGRQALPMLLNECFVRAFYFIRRLIVELKEKKSLSQVDWVRTLPWKNRTIVRMLTIAHGTFIAVDLGDAAIRAAIKAGEASAATGGTTGGAAEALSFTKEFILRVNFVGIGRFAVAVYSDGKMGWQLNEKTNEKLTLICHQLQLMQAKVFYRQASMWVAAKDTEQAIQDATAAAQQAVVFYIDSLAQMETDMETVGWHVKKLDSQDRAELRDLLKWG